MWSSLISHYTCYMRWGTILLKIHISQRSNWYKIHEVFQMVPSIFLYIHVLLKFLHKIYKNIFHSTNSTKHPIQNSLVFTERRINLYFNMNFSYMKHRRLWHNSSSSTFTEYQHVILFLNREKIEWNEDNWVLPFKKIGVYLRFKRKNLNANFIPIDVAHMV